MSDVIPLPIIDKCEYCKKLLEEIESLRNKLTSEIDTMKIELKILKDDNNFYKKHFENNLEIIEKIVSKSKR